MVNPVRIRKIISEKHLNESNKDFKKFLVGKKPATQKRYKSYRNLVMKKRNQGYNIKAEKNYIVFHKKKRRAGADLPDYRDIPETALSVTYGHAFHFTCKYDKVSETQIIEHRHVLESRSKKPNAVRNLISHNKAFPTHTVLEQEYEGTWVNY